MAFGRKVKEGHLAVFSVTTEEEAQALIVLTCPMDDEGKPYARELAAEQTLENLEAFSTKLDKAHDHMIANGNCRCKPVPRKHRAKKRK